MNTIFTGVELSSLSSHYRYVTYLQIIDKTGGDATCKMLVSTL